MKYNDDVIIESLHRQNREAFIMLKERYRKLLSALSFNFSSSFIRSGITRQEFDIVCSSAFYRAIIKYELGKNSLYMYVKQVVINDAYAYINANSYTSNTVSTFHGSFSLDDYQFENEKKSFRGDFISETNQENINESRRVYLEKLINCNEVKMSKTEKEVLQLRLDGYEIKEIMVIMNKKQSCLYAALEKAISKLCIYIKKSRSNN